MNAILTSPGDELGKWEAYFVRYALPVIGLGIYAFQ